MRPVFCAFPQSARVAAAQHPEPLRATLPTHVQAAARSGDTPARCKDSVENLSRKARVK
jgi:hypothetical protein